jgi:hypothetical protein
MFFNSGFYEIKASQHVHYLFVDCYAHVCTIILYIE